MRQDQWLITVSVDGSNLGTFDKCDGGDIDSSETKYMPGGMAPEKVLGGVATVSNVTVTRLFEADRDSEVARALASRAGRASMSVSKQPLDVDGNPFGSPTVYTGILKKVTVPPADSGATGASTWALELSTSGGVA